MTRRENTQHRRSPVRRSRPLVLVVCGAKCTEPQYFRSLRDSLRSRAVDIVLAHHPKAPFQVVEYASVYAKRSNRDFDEIWCVVDVDEFDLEPTVQLARRSGVQLAVSNPCFELWLLLHFEDSRGQLSQCAAAHKQILRFVPGYDKTRLDFRCFERGVGDAVQRAKALDPSGGRFELNPSTSVWRLVERMME
jgi:RloB-like protein